MATKGYWTYTLNKSESGYLLRCGNILIGYVCWGDNPVTTSKEEAEVNAQAICDAMNRKGQS